MLGLAHIGAPHQQFGWHARGQVAQQTLARQRQCCRQGRGHVVRQRLPHQQVEHVLVQRALAQGLGLHHPCSLQQRFGLAVVQFGADALVEFELCQFERLFARRQRVARYAQQLFVGQQAEIAAGDRGHQGHLNRFAGFFGAQQLRLRGLAETAHAAKKVELVTRYLKAGAVHAAGTVAAGGGLA